MLRRAILMQGFDNRDALATTISSRKATFYSRSRSRSTLWTKGETSLNFINVHDIFIDCDRDSVIYIGSPYGPTCPTGSEICYYTSVFDILNSSEFRGRRLRVMLNTGGARRQIADCLRDGRCALPCHGFVSSKKRKSRRGSTSSSTEIYTIRH